MEWMGDLSLPILVPQNSFQFIQHFYNIFIFLGNGKRNSCNWPQHNWDKVTIRIEEISSKKMKGQKY